MKVPENYEDCRVIYYLPLPEPHPNAEGELATVAYALVECPVPVGSYSRKQGKPPPTQLFAIEIDQNGQPDWESDYWHENEAAFFEDLARWGSELPLLKPGDEIPERR